MYLYVYVCSNHVVILCTLALLDCELAVAKKLVIYIYIYYIYIPITLYSCLPQPTSSAIAVAWAFEVFFFFQKKFYLSYIFQFFSIRACPDIVPSFVHFNFVYNRCFSYIYIIF